MDIGCSNHMKCIREWLVNFDDSREARIRFNNNMNVPLKGVGILIKDRYENQALVTSVLYVSSMMSNLLSMGKKF